MSRRVLKCGYVPLVDSAPLIIARELAFDQQEGIELDLVSKPSWSALRDHLAFGSIDAAHMLAPMPIAMSLGLSGIKVATHALMMMSVNGTVLGVSNSVAKRMIANGWDGSFESPNAAKSHLLAASVDPLRIGIPFPFSMHHLLIRYLLGDNTDRFTFVTTPPSQMADAVGAGDIDIFIVGEPWGTVVVESGVGRLLLSGADIWQFAPEKVLAARAEWLDQHPEAAGKLMRAIYKACGWLDQSENHALASEILSRSENLDLPEAAIDRALTGQIVPIKGGAPHKVENFLMFNRGGANFPWRSQAAWIGEQIAEFSDIDRAQSLQTAQSCFRPDVYRNQMGKMAVDMPGASSKLEGAMTHRTEVASTKGEMILGPDAFFDGKIYEVTEKK